MRFLFLFLTLLSACQRERITERDREWRAQNGKLKVLSTIAMIDDLVHTIGGENVDTVALIRGDLDPHSYELVKGDDERFANADLIFYNGLGLEHGVSLRQHLDGNPKAIGVGNPILERQPDKILVVDGQYDPHIWMDIALWVQTIDPIVEALVTKDPQNASSYKERGEALRAQMEEADAYACKTLQSLPKERRYLVTSHDAFNYFTRHYLADPEESAWEERCEAPEGLAPDAQLSVTDIRLIIDHVQKFNVKVLFPESNVSKDALRKIVSAGREKGCELHLCEAELYGDAMGGARSYLEMILHNVNIIAGELAR